MTRREDGHYSINDRDAQIILRELLSFSVKLNKLKKDIVPDQDETNVKRRYKE